MILVFDYKPAFLYPFGSQEYFTGIYSEGLLRPSHTTFVVHGDLALSAFFVLDNDMIDNRRG
jgi:hypothetical protein